MTFEYGWNGKQYVRKSKGEYALLLASWSMVASHLARSLIAFGKEKTGITHECFNKDPLVLLPNSVPTQKSKVIEPLT